MLRMKHDLNWLRVRRLEALSRLVFPKNSPSMARSLYGATKLASEFLLQEYIDMCGIRGVINRCSVLTGPWQMGKIDQGVAVLWVAKHIYMGKLNYLGYGGKGKQVRDLLHIDDLYELIRLQLNKMDRYNGEVYNVGGGRDLSISLCELTQLCRELTGNQIEITSVNENRDADIPYFVTDFSKVHRNTGWHPRRNLRKMIQETFTWINENKEILTPILS